MGTFGPGNGDIVRLIADLWISGPLPNHSGWSGSTNPRKRACGKQKRLTSGLDLELG